MAKHPPQANKQNAVDEQVADVKVDVPYGVTANSYNIPAVCACCLTPTENKVTARWGETRKYSTGTHRVTESSSATLDFCVCPDCVAHEKDYERNSSRMIMISVLLSSLVAAAFLRWSAPVLNPLAESHLGLVFLFCLVLAPIILVMLLMVALDFLFPLKPLDHRHASRMKGVRMVGPHRFEFDNLAYAQLFAQKNGEQAKFTSPAGGRVLNSPYKVELKIKESSFNYKIRGKSLLQGAPLLKIALTSAGVSVVLTLIFSLILQAFLEPPMAGHPATYICGGFVLLVIIIAFTEERKKIKSKT